MSLTAESPLHGGSIILKVVNDAINNETMYSTVSMMPANGGVVGCIIQVLFRQFGMEMWRETKKFFPSGIFCLQ